MKYECTVCGHIYDEEAEGVKFEDLPEDWVCPLCGVGKDMFKKSWRIIFSKKVTYLVTFLSYQNKNRKRKYVDIPYILW